MTEKQEKRSSRRPSEGDLHIIMTGKELEEIKVTFRAKEFLICKCRVGTYECFVFNVNKFREYERRSMQKYFRMWLIY